MNVNPADPAMLRKEEREARPRPQDVVKEALPLVRSELSRHRVVLKLELAPGLPR